MCVLTVAPPGVSPRSCTRRHRIPRPFTISVQAGKQRIDQLTGYLAHALVVLAAVSGFLTVGVTVAHRFPAAVLKALVVAAGAAVGTLPLPAARLGRRDQFSAEKRQISTNDKAEARRTPSTRTHDGNFFFFFWSTCSTRPLAALLCLRHNGCRGKPIYSGQKSKLR